MPLRLGSAAELNAILKLSIDEQSAQHTQQVAAQTGRVVNEMTVEEFRMAASQAALFENTLADIEKRTAAIQREWWRTQRVLRASSFIFREFAIVGTALWAPLVANAVKYGKEMEKAGDVTDPVIQKWLQGTRALNSARQSIGRTTIEVLLPYLDKAAQLADKAARVVEKNPQLIEAALKTGIAVTTVGVLGSLVTKGIQMYVDIKFVAASAQNLLAARIMEKASSQNLAAAGAGLGGGQGLAGKVLSGASTVGKIGLAGAAQVGLSYEYSKVFDQLYSSAPALGKLSGVGKGLTYVLERLVGQFVPLIPQFRLFNNLVSTFRGTIDKVTGSASKGTAAVIHFADAMERIKKEQEGGIAILELQRDLVEATRKYQEDRKGIIQDGNEAALSIQRNYAKSVMDAYNTMVRNIDNLTKDFNKDNRRAEEDYLLSRREIVQQGNQDTIRAEQDLQEKLRQLRLDHEDRVDELTRERDALGLVKEQRRYDREVDEATREANQRIGRLRQDIAERLREEDRGYALARQRRYEDYLEKVQEARDRYDQDKEEAKQRRAEELQALKDAQEEKLQALKIAYDREKRDAVNAAYEKIVLLQGALNAELKMNQLYHGLILDETRKFLADYLKLLDIDTLSGLDANKTIGTRQSGGSIFTTGKYLLHEGEEVLSASTVTAAQQAIGGTFSQTKLLGVLAGGASRIYYYDHRRIDADLSPKQRNEIAQDIIERMAGAFRT